ncbi:MAG: transposase [Anaerolineae bacterium]|nr:transposase [Anaerolineae bacterium]
MTITFATGSASKTCVSIDRRDLGLFQACKPAFGGARFIGSVRRECLDHILILSEKHVRCVIREYCAFFNRARPHQGIDEQIPIPSYDVGLPEHARRKVIGVPILNGLHHDYQWAA